MSITLNDKIHLEVNFETYITKKLAMLEGDGWRISDNDAGFDPNTALYLPDFIEYVSTTAPDKVEKMQKAYEANWENNLVAVPAERWNSALKAQQNAYNAWKSVQDKAKETNDNDTVKQAEIQLKNIQDELDKLMDFRKKLKRYSAAYEYITQIVDPGARFFHEA